MEERVFNCMCGHTFIGTDIDYNEHLETECPVYKKAAINLVAIKNLENIIKKD